MNQIKIKSSEVFVKAKCHCGAEPSIAAMIVGYEDFADGYVCGNCHRRFPVPRVANARHDCEMDLWKFSTLVGSPMTTVTLRPDDPSENTEKVRLCPHCLELCFSWRSNGREEAGTKDDEGLGEAGDSGSSELDGLSLDETS